MTDYIIIAILVVILSFALSQTWKRLKGETSCCGGSTYKACSKKINRVAAKKTFIVEGMTCQHCVNRVMEAVQSLEGVSASVYLKKGEVIVSMEEEIPDETITAAIEKAGYSVQAIK